MHRERAIYLLVMVSLVILAVVVIAMVFGSKDLQRTFSVMERSTCDQDGVCEEAEANACADCAQNLAGELSLAEGAAREPLDSRMLLALGIGAAVVVLELVLISRRR